MPDRHPPFDPRRVEAERHRDIARRAPPLPAVPPPFPGQPPLDASLADLCGLWLDVRCGCGASSYPPLRLLAATHGWRVRLGDVVPRLRCRRCGSRPASVYLIDNPAAGAVGAAGATGRRLKLV